MGVHSDVHNEHGYFWGSFEQNRCSGDSNKPRKNPPVHSYINFLLLLKPPYLENEHPIH